MTEASVTVHDGTPEPPRYLWWQGATVRALRDRLNDAGPDAILQLHAPFNEHAMLEVIDPSQDAAARLAPLNEAHPCPPQCI